ELRERCAGEGVTVADGTATTALVAVQGPAADQIVPFVVEGDAGPEVHDLLYYAAVPAPVAGASVLVARAGYTGEDGSEPFGEAGVEFLVASESAPRAWAALLERGERLGMVPAGLAARASLRLAAGMPLYGHELDRTTTTYDARLGRVVRLDKTGPDGAPLPFV